MHYFISFVYEVRRHYYAKEKITAVRNYSFILYNLITLYVTLFIIELRT